MSILTRRPGGLVSAAVGAVLGLSAWAMVVHGSTVPGPADPSPAPAVHASGVRAPGLPGAEGAGLPRIGFSDSTLYFQTAFNGSSPPGQSFKLINTAEVGTLNWSLHADRYFVGAGPEKGYSNEATIQVWIIASTDLQMGLHTAHIIVSAPNAINSPETVFVQVRILCPIGLTGDCNADGAVTQADIVYLVNHVLKAGPSPVPLEEAGDVNCDRSVGLTDVIFLVNYVLKAGPAPCDACSLL
jgi:hypothetical protein